MTAAERDYFTDMSILRNPYDFFEGLRKYGPVYKYPDRDLIIITGFQESVDVLLNPDVFSNAYNVTPDQPLPFVPEGADISAQLDAHRGDNPMLDLMVTYDGARHTAARSLLTRLFVPSRLKANEQYMRGLAIKMVGDLVAKGGAEMVNELATPFVTLVVADLLGVPDDDREKFREVIDNGPPAGNMDGGDERNQGAALMFMAGFFMQYVADRRANPRDDILSELANQTYADGSLPDQIEIVKSAMFLFAAGQDTSAKLLGNSVRYLVENKDMQNKLRADYSLIPAFLEEMLRLEGSTKSTFRVTRKDSNIGDIPVKAGTRIIVALSAANRDSNRWPDAAEFELNRPRIKEHVAFGRGAHTCIGAPLARAEVRVMLEELFNLTSDMSLNENIHGPVSDSNLEYEPSYIIRGLENLHVKLTA